MVSCLGELLFLEDLKFKVCVVMACVWWILVSQHYSCS